MILYGEEAREKLLAGIEKVAEAVKVTLGPKARTVVIEQNGAPLIINDGVTIAKSMYDDDAFIQLGIELLQEVASQAQDTAGDGTTTASILAHRMCTEGMALVKEGLCPISLKKEFEEAILEVTEKLTEWAKPVEDKESIKQVASIAANNDEELGGLIADVVDEVGKSGVISVESSSNMETSFEVVEGIEINRGYVSHVMVTNNEEGTAEMPNPLVLMCNHEIKRMNDIIPALEIAIANKKPLLILCQELEGQALGNILFNVAQRNVDCCVVRAPNFGDEQIEELEDIAAVIGGRVFNNDVGQDISKVTLNDLGQATRVVAHKFNTVIMGGSNDVKNRIEVLEGRLAQADNDWERDKIQSRIGKLAGGVAVIRVGAATEVEMKEKKERLDDALNATRAALQEGIVVGGGLALYNAAEQLGGKESLGYKIVKDAIQMPIHQICRNTGESLNIQDLTASQGYNALTNRYEDLMEAGVIDPVKVTKSALRAAASIAGLVLTTEVLVLKRPVENPMGMF